LYSHDIIAGSADIPKLFAGGKRLGLMPTMAKWDSWDAYEHDDWTKKSDVVQVPRQEFV